MRAEVNRSAEIMKMVEDGHFNDALTAIQSDIEASGSDQTVSAFNRIKKEATETGEWDWRPPIHMMRKAKLSTVYLGDCMSK